MATQGTSNIAGTQAGTGVPIGKTGTTGTTGLAGTQPSQIGVQGGLVGTQAGTMGTQTGLETGQTTYGGPTQQLGGTYGTGQNVAGQQYGQGQYGQGQYGGYGQERESRGLFGDIENWFRDPFNVGFGGLFHRRRRGGRDYPEDTQYGQGGYGQGTYGQQQLGYGQPYGQGTYQGSQEYGMTPYNQYGRGGQGGLFFPEMSLLEGGGFGGLDLMNRELSSLGSFTPSMRMDIQENAAEYICKVDMPGVSFGDVNVECDDRTRTIHVNVRKNLREEKDEDVMGTRVHRIERASGTGYRAIRMPPNVDLNNIRADLREGVLFINVPKTSEAQAFGRKRIPLGGTNAMMGTGTNLTGSNISSTTMGGNISGGGVRQGLATGTTGTNVGNVTGTSYSQGTSGYGQSGNIASGNVGSTGTTGMSGSNVSGARQL